MKGKIKVLIGINACGLVATLAFIFFYMVYFPETAIVLSKEEFIKAMSQAEFNENFRNAAETLLSNIKFSQMVCMFLLYCSLIFSAISFILFCINIVTAIRMNK